MNMDSYQMCQQIVSSLSSRDLYLVAQLALIDKKITLSDVTRNYNIYLEERYDERNSQYTDAIFVISALTSGSDETKRRMTNKVPGIILQSQIFKGTPYEKELHTQYACLTDRPTQRKKRTPSPRARHPRR